VQIMIQKDERIVSVEELSFTKHAKLLSFSAALSIISSPDTGKKLRVIGNGSFLSDGKHKYAIINQNVILLPEKLQPYFDQKLVIPHACSSVDPFLQYFYLSTVKQSGDIGAINASVGDVHYKRHLFRMRELLSSAEGVVLDVGCDDPTIGASLLPESVSYLGLDPFSSNADGLRLVGVGECLPICDASVDGVVFKTSLDHILDWRKAIDEAYRVLRPGGVVFICSLAWSKNAELFNDSVHFHHFREDELLLGLQRFELISLTRYDYKGNEHRHGVYLAASKRL